MSVSDHFIRGTNRGRKTENLIEETSSYSVTVIRLLALPFEQMFEIRQVTPTHFLSKMRRHHYPNNHLKCKL